MAGPPARRQRAPKLSSTACRALSGWARRTSRAGLSCHLPLRTLARGCRRRRVVRPRVRGQSSSSGRAHYASGSARAPTSAASPRRRWTSGLRAAPARTPRRPRPRRSARAASWSSWRCASAARRHSAVRARPASQPAVRRAARRRSRRLATLRPANDASPSQQASREHDARPFPVVVPSRATPRRSQSMYSRIISTQRPCQVGKGPTHTERLAKLTRRRESSLSQSFHGV